MTSRIVSCLNCKIKIYRALNDLTKSVRQIKENVAAIRSMYVLSMSRSLFQVYNFSKTKGFIVSTNIFEIRNRAESM